MKRSPPLVRTSITLPESQLASADQLAATLDRSRSWVFAEAIRRWAQPVAGQDREARPTAPKTAPTPPLPASMPPAKALQLSAAARLRMAQELVAAMRRRRPRPTRLQIIAFESQQDFHSWKAAQ